MNFIAAHFALVSDPTDHSGPIVLGALVAALIIGALVCSWREHHHDR